MRGFCWALIGGQVRQSGERKEEASASERERERDQATEKEVLIMFVCLDQAVKSGEKANCMNVSCQCHSRLVFYLMLLIIFMHVFWRGFLRSRLLSGTPRGELIVVG